MKIPEKNLPDFCSELVKQCMHSRQERLTNYGYFRQYYFQGTDQGSPAIYNRCYPHCDRLSSYLFSPSEVHFQLTFDTPDKTLLNQGKIAAPYLSYEFHRSGVDNE